jgi:hypothetical protein
MPEKYHVRRHLFVDPKVQSALAARVVFYWLACLVSMTLLLFCWRIVSSPSASFAAHLRALWLNYGPALAVSALLLPLVIIDVIRFSNRFVGPLLRLRRSLRELARGEDVAPLQFRDSDFLRELAGEFNAVRAKVLAAAGSATTERKERAEEEEPVAVAS